MNKNEYTKLDDDKLVAILDDNIRRSVGYYDSQISRERKRVMEYYNGTLPRPAHDGNSKYVSMDVYDTVESCKAVLLETFSTGYKTVRFAPQNADDTAIAEVASEYCDYVANRQNNLFEVMQSVIHSALVARVGLAKVFYYYGDESHIEEVTDLTEEELDQILSQDNVEIEELTEDVAGLSSGELRVTTPANKICIESIAPEEFIIEPQAKATPRRLRRKANKQHW
jgi:hypothetical protein